VGSNSDRRVSAVHLPFLRRRLDVFRARPGPFIVVADIATVPALSDAVAEGASAPRIAPQREVRLATPQSLCSSLRNSFLCAQSYHGPLASTIGSNAEPADPTDKPTSKHFAGVPPTARMKWAMSIIDFGESPPSGDTAATWHGRLKGLVPCAANGSSGRCQPSAGGVQFLQRRFRSLPLADTWGAGASSFFTRGAHRPATSPPSPF
jgi:hypothetical protein